MTNAPSDPIDQQHDAFVDTLFSTVRRPYVTVTAIVLNLAVFLIMGLAGVGWLSPSSHKMIAWGANYAPLTVHGEWWRLLTAAFLHFGIIHIGMNMWALYAAGGLTERLYGNGFFLLIYLFGAVVSSMASAWWQPNAIEAGASGAVFAVYGALLAYMVFQKKSFPTAVLQPMFKSTLLFTGYNVLFGLSSKQISNSAHIGGLISGFVLGMILCRPLVVESRRRQALPRLIVALIAGTAILAGGISLLPKAAAAATAEQEFLADLNSVSPQVQRVMDTWQQLEAAAQAGKLNNAQLAKRLRQEVIPVWQAIVERLAADVVPSQSQLKPLHDAVVQTYETRLAAFTLLAEGLEGGDQGKVVQFTFLMQRADAMTQEINRHLHPGNP